VSEIEAKLKEHDDVTILEGEPFDQAEAFAVLVGNLKEKNLHLTLYTGYNIENLREHDEPCISDILSHVDPLIDGALHPRARKKRRRIPRLVQLETHSSRQYFVMLSRHT
jgi:organic radical activating enzyme